MLGLGSDLGEHLSGLLSEGTGGFHGVLEFFLVDVTGSILVDHVEDFFGLLHVVLGDLVVVLGSDLLEEGDKLVPGDGLGTIGIELLENLFPGWWLWLSVFDLGLGEHVSGFLSEGSVSLHGHVELVLIDLTGSILVDHLEDFVDLLEFLLGEWVVVLSSEFLDPLLKLWPGNGTVVVGIELLKDLLPGWGWWSLGGDLGEHLSGLLSESTGGLHGVLEFLLVDVTRSILVDHLEDFVGLLEVILGELVVVLGGNLLEEGDKLWPGNGTGSIGVELLKDLFPGWWLWLSGLVQRADLDSGNSGHNGGNSEEFHFCVFLFLFNLQDTEILPLK